MAVPLMDAPLDPRGSSPAHPVAPRIPSLLLVDSDLVDSVPLRRAIRAALPDSPLHIASGQAQAQLMLVTVRPDVVLVNLDLHDGSAFGVIAAAHGRVPRPLPIVVAARANDDRVLQALRAGAGGALLRHDSEEQVRDALRGALAGMAPLSPPLAQQLIRHFDRGASEAPTAAEREVLTWVAAGDTLLEASTRMRITLAEALDHVATLYARAGIAAIHKREGLP